MKKLFFIIFLFVVVPFFNDSIFARNSGTNCIISSNIDLDGSVPDHVMELFTRSFVYEDGFFRGAQINMLQPYLSQSEIRALVESFINHPPNAMTVIYEGYKPKPRGCVANSRWICVLIGDVIRQ